MKHQTATVAVTCIFLAISQSTSAIEFTPALLVNDQAITRYELDQRALFLQALGTSGNPRQEARSILIEERLKEAEFESAGIEVTAEQIERGMLEFASRANLTSEEFIAALQNAGVAELTFRQFIENGVGWREFIRQRFLARARPTDEEIDRALAADDGIGGLTVLLSEIILPINAAEIEDVRAQAETIAQIASIEEFSDAARQFSAATSAVDGGQLNWMQLSDQPARLRPQILALAPGQVTDPIILPNSILLYQLRDMRETTAASRDFSAIDYATFTIKNASVSNILALVDTCDDLYGIARDTSPEALSREVLPPEEIPNDIAPVLADLDADEFAILPPPDGDEGSRLLMLCGRTAAINQAAARDDIADALLQQRLTAFAASYLDQLLANALIIEND
ncbi:MAG: peptidylprolyl isomerase [Aestuariivita sp.]|nr:peptidylprolyl isomerase [Aestuariivita sp.]MCY4345305.1 peptidylprolyl isomerase [Aestuariivita sp.]